MNKVGTKKLLTAIIALVIIIAAPQSARAYDLSLLSKAAFLIEETTGKVLYEKNADERLYPASLTKIMTALVFLEYLEPSEYVVTGPEINEVPWDSSKAYHLNGETLLAENIVRGLIIPSGNETACVAAKAVAERVEGVTGMDYNRAEALFCKLMNEKAKDLGAVSTNFVNPHGYHNDNHYTTARDMALIAQEAIKNDLIRSIVGEMEFIGNGAGENPDPAWKTKDYDWPTHNKMIVRGNEFFYSFATGIKTGFTDEAGYCFAVSAEKDDRRLIAVTLNVENEDDRWFDARVLLEFGFNNFGDETIQTAGEALTEVTIANPKLGESDMLSLVAAESVVRYLSGEEIERISIETDINPDLLTEGGVMAPISAEQHIGSVRLILDGEAIYEGALLAAEDVAERTFKSDVQYHFDNFMDAAFSTKAVPFWIGGIVGVLVIIRIIIMLRRNGRRHRNPYRFVKNRRRY